MRLFRASGGLLYHWRALWSFGRWRPFRREVAAWLAEWRPPARELILIGPSAGHTLPTKWLRGFDRVYAYDLDPLAPALFRLRHFGVRVRFRREDAFWRDSRLSPAGLERILGRHADAAVLFSNVIGQVLLEGRAEEAEWLSFLAGVRTRLANRSWASYHDLFTHEEGEVIDHLTSGAWTAGLARRRLSWALTPTSRHEVEAVHQP